MILIANTKDGRFLVGVETFELDKRSQFRSVWYMRNGSTWSNLVCIASPLSEVEAYSVAITLKDFYKRGIHITDVGDRKLELLPPSISMVEIDDHGRIIKMRYLGI